MELLVAANRPIPVKRANIRSARTSAAPRLPLVGLLRRNCLIVGYFIINPSPCPLPQGERVEMVPQGERAERVPHGERVEDERKDTILPSLLPSLLESEALILPSPLVGEGRVRGANKLFNFRI
jgi:hypothetical protein